MSKETVGCVLPCVDIELGCSKPACAHEEREQMGFGWMKCRRRLVGSEVAQPRT